MDPMTLISLISMGKDILGGGPAPKAGPTGPSKFSLGIKDSMAGAPTTDSFANLNKGTYLEPGSGYTPGEITGETPYGGGGGEGSFLSAGPTDHMSKIAGGPPPAGNVFESAAPGGGGGDEAIGGLPPWFQKLGAGAQVGQALSPKAPPPPSLPGGGRFGGENSILQWLQMMGRR